MGRKRRKRNIALKILVTAKYTTGKVHEGGSSRFMKCAIDTLAEMGHEVSTDIDKPCDLIICSHNLDKIKDNPARKVLISHGIIGDEKFKTGADKYISISEEIQAMNNINGFKSDIVFQPIKIGKQSRPNSKLKNILIIRRKEQLKAEPFAFLSEKYNIKVSDPDIPIEDQIDWADLCIALGRGALESMAQGKPVLIADNRKYIGALGDGYVTQGNIHEIAQNNFSGRRFRIHITQDWVESELKRYNPNDSEFLYNYVKENHDAKKIVMNYLDDKKIVEQKPAIAFGCMFNDNKRLDMVLRNSAIGNFPCFTVYDPESATKGLNTLLDTIEKSDARIGILTHQDMFYREHWLPAVEKQIALLPENWVIAGIVGKDEKGILCGRFHDMSSPLWIASDHDFPVQCSCIDECTIIVNMKTGFRFDESLEGWDLYGTYACLRAQEIGTAWIIDAWAEHYCTRFHNEWEPCPVFMKMWKWLYDRFPGKYLDSTVLVGKEQEKEFSRKNKAKITYNEFERMKAA